MKYSLVPAFLLGGLTLFSLWTTETLVGLNQNQAEFRAETDEVDEGGFLQVGKLVLDGNLYVAREEIEAEVSPFFGEFVLNVSEADILTQVLRHPWIRSARVNLGLFSGTINLNIQEERPAYTVTSGGVIWVVATDGSLIVPLSAVQDKDLLESISLLPMIDASSTTVFSRGVFSLVAFNPSETLPFDVEEIRLEKNWLRLVPFDFESRPEVLVPYVSADGYESHKNNLKALLVQLDKEDLVAGEVDLRFDDKAIVRRTRAK